MKKKQKNYRYYLKVINQIQNVRKKNNQNWMDLLKLSFKHDSTGTKKIVREIFKEDKKVTNLTKKLIKN